MLFNNARCQILTPEYVNSASGLDLHQFKWLGGDDFIGEIHGKWNYLVGCHAKEQNAAIVHFTMGGPYFKEYQNCEYSAEWQEEKLSTLRVKEK